MILWTSVNLVEILESNRTSAKESVGNYESRWHKNSLMKNAQNYFSKGSRLAVVV
jgi:hypothetical protein